MDLFDLFFAWLGLVIVLFGVFAAANHLTKSRARDDMNSARLDP